MIRIKYGVYTNHKRTKLRPRAIKGIFIGYAQNFKAHRILDSVFNIVVESREVEFIENKFINDLAPNLEYPQKDT